MPPPQPPTRTADGPYHFHTYDYAGSTDAGPFQLSPAQPGRGQFYSLVADLNGLYDVGRENQVPNITLAAAGARIPPPTPDDKNRWTMRLSFGNRGNDADAPTVVITGGIHAREWISPEMAYLLAEYLIMHYSTGPVNDYQRAIRSLINGRNIHIIPMLNPHGNHYTVFGQGQNDDPRMWRKNRRALPITAEQWMTALTDPLGNANLPFQNVLPPLPPSSFARYDVPNYDPAGKIPPTFQTRKLAPQQTGVDLNRNFDTRAWGYDSPTPTSVGPPEYFGYDPGNECYFGPNRDSEVETKNIESALAAIDVSWLATTIDYHSYGQCVLYPSEAFNTGAVGYDYGALGKTLQQLIRSQDVLDYRLGSVMEILGYEATGSVTDYIAQRSHARVFAIELDPTSKNPGFQLPEDQIRTVFEKNIRGALAAIGSPRPATANWSSAMRRSRKIAQAEAQFLGWNVYGQGNQLPA